MVTASTTSRPLTLEDLRAMPESAERYEILQGELIVTLPPRSEHQDLSQALSYAFESVVRRERLGKVYAAPVGVRLGRNDIVQPDLLFLSNAKKQLIVHGIVEGPPDLIVEILSPSTRRVDLVRKMALYLEAGVQEYWIVDPEQRTITVYSLVRGNYETLATTGGVARSQVIPGVGIDIDAMFCDVWWSE